MTDKIDVLKVLNIPNTVSICPACKEEYYGDFVGICPMCQEKYHKKRVREQDLMALVGGEKPYKEYTFDKYRQNNDNLTAYKLLKDFNPGKDNIYLAGSCGVGKTHLATAAIRRLFIEDFKCKIFNLPEISRYCRSNNTKNEEERVTEIAGTQVLLIDDLGVGKATEYSSQILYEIINKRINAYRNGLIITSNLTLNDLALKMGDDRLSSRINGLCKKITIIGTDYRSVK